MNDERLIKSPSQNDVLVGRGFGSREHSGTRLYHELCKLHREEYCSTNTQENKYIVAYRIINTINSLDPPGRFLQLVSREKARKEGFADDDGGGSVWEEMDCNTTLKKVKQSLRDISKKPKEKTPVELQNALPSNPPPDMHLEYQTSVSTHAGSEDSAPASLAVAKNAADVEDPVAAAEQLYTLLTADGDGEAPKFTEEEYKREQERLTEEERVAVLNDLFGSACSISNHVRKRTRLTARNSVADLLQDMRRAIECIPKKEKSSLLEAQTKADPSEFSDSRFEQFLHREDMDPQNAAKRLVLYWEERRKLFGPAKYLMNMTLDEALKDDLPSLRAGVFCFIPRRDLSGRNLIFKDQSRRIPEQHTSESLLRVFWFLLEIVAQGNNDKVSEFVLLSWEKNSTLWDYDGNIDNRFVDLEKRCLPVRLSAVHVCCPTRLVAFVIKPIWYAVMDKRTRQRTIVHDVPERQLPEVLASYGILKDMLPSEMGGAVSLSQLVETAELS